MKKSKCFTLAETMIVFIILAIIAVLVIPNLINNYNKRQTISMLKMAYSLVDNMVQQSYVENGYPPVFSSPYKEVFDGYFGKYLNIDKYCGIAIKDSELKNTGCFKQGSYKDNNADTEYSKDNDGNENKSDMIYTLDGNAQASAGYNPRYYNKALLKNGMGLAIWHYPATWAPYVILVDINGPNKGDSKLGQDVFMFSYFDPQAGGKCPNTMLLPGVVYPENLGKDCKYSRNNFIAMCKENGTYQGHHWNGMGCSGLIVHDGWKISSDYPWNYAQKKNTR